MTKMDYLELLVDEIHSTTVATIGSDGHPQTRIIDMMYISGNWQVHQFLLLMLTEAVIYSLSILSSLL